MFTQLAPARGASEGNCLQVSAYLPQALLFVGKGFNCGGIHMASWIFRQALGLRLGPKGSVQAWSRSFLGAGSMPFPSERYLTGFSFCSTMCPQGSPGHCTEEPAWGYYTEDLCKCNSWGGLGRFRLRCQIVRQDGFHIRNS
jgi:hypothetical protein